MKKRLKRALAILLSLVMMAVIIPSGIFTASATSKTADEAIAWVRSKLGTSVGYDDGSGEYQCVELIQGYYDFLGVPRSYGNGCDYATNTRPDGWDRVAGGQPQKGDILVYTGGYKGYGHVAIYESDYST